MWYVLNVLSVPKLKVGTVAYVVVPKPRIIAVVSVFYFRSNVFYITELWPINRQIYVMIWGDHRSVWRMLGIRHSCSSSVFETVSMGCGWREVGLDTVSLETVCGDLVLVLVQLFLVFYSSGLHFLHPCAIRTISCLALDNVFSIISLTIWFLRHNFLVTVRLKIF